MTSRHKIRLGHKRSVMKKILTLFLIFIFSITLLLSCDNGDTNITDTSGKVTMTARIEAMGDKIEVMVTESEYTWGTHLVITSDTTKYIGKGGEEIKRGDLSVGQTVEITYSGQVMLSYPPQIVAHRIAVK